MDSHPLAKRKYAKLSGAQRKRQKRLHDEEDKIQGASLLKFLNPGTGPAPSISTSVETSGSIVSEKLLQIHVRSSDDLSEEISPTSIPKQTSSSNTGQSGLISVESTSLEKKFEHSLRNCAVQDYTPLNSVMDFDPAQTLTDFPQIKTLKSSKGFSEAVIVSTIPELASSSITGKSGLISVETTYPEKNLDNSLRNCAVQDDTQLTSLMNLDSSPKVLIDFLPNQTNEIGNDTELENLLSQKWPSDPIYYGGRSGSELNFETKKFLLKVGPCQPTKDQCQFPKNKYGGHFTPAIYQQRHPKTGKEIARSWIHYSVKHDRLYCFCCWLFSKTSDPNYDPAFSRVGVCNWRKIHDKVAKHEKSSLHRNALISWKMVGSNTLIDRDLQQQYEHEVANWKDILKRIIDVILLLSAQNMAFRGSVEQIGHRHSGNFLALVYLLAKYDLVLHNQINKKEGVKYLSNRIQNELIVLLGKQVQQAIIDAIKNARYYSVMVDTTTDTSHTDQLSFIIRYVQIDDQVKVTESFLGFICIPGDEARATDFVVKILSFLENLGLDIANCRGQSYDGASVMKGYSSGVQARIKEQNPLAVYVHCAPHTLNLVIADSAKVDPEIVTFFGVVQKLYTFFSSSNHRWEMLIKASDPAMASERIHECDPTEDMLQKTNDEIPENQQDNSLPKRSVIVKQVCTTCWEGRLSPIRNLRKALPKIIDVLKCIKSESKDGSENCDCDGLLSYISKFYFIVMLVIWEKILTLLNITSKYLQKADCDILTAADLLQSSTKNIQNMRANEFSSFMDEAIQLASKLGVSVQLSEKRQRRKVSFSDELTNDEPITDKNKAFEVNIYNRMLDRIIASLSERFEGLRDVANMFSFMYPCRLMKLSSNDLQKSCEQLTRHYERDLDSGLYSELLSLRNILADKLPPKSKPKDVIQIIVNNDLQEAFTESFTAYKLLLTIPVSIASCERSFSKLKLIKNYLRSTIAQERLSGLAILSIESDIARNLSFDTVIEQFVAIKARRLH